MIYCTRRVNMLTSMFLKITLCIYIYPYFCWIFRYPEGSIGKVVVLLTGLTTFSMSIAIQGMEGLVKFVSDYCLNFLLNKRIGDTDYVWSNPHFHIVVFLLFIIRGLFVKFVDRSQFS